jgi:hypothetical protein
VIGGDGAWAPAAPGGGRPGGIAITGSFALSGTNFPNLGFVFPKQLVNGTPRYVAEAAAHEAGHGFGLSHQSLYTDSGVIEYNPGDAQRAPIMGRSYFAQRGQWWLGPTSDNSSPTAQDDLALISATGTLTNGFGYRVDDHPNDPVASAGDPIAIGADMSITAKGIITKTDDVDVFSFTAPGGPAHLVANVAEFAPMLDLSLNLYDGSGTLLATSATANLGEFIDYLLAPGQTYKVGVFSAGNYGDIGQYTISGYVPEPASATALFLLPLSFLSRRRR